MLKVRMTGTIIWNGKKYGPGEAVSVPEDMAEALRLTPAAKTQEGAALPDDFPARDLILGTDFKTLAAIQAASDDDLLAVDGIGPATLKQIRAYKG